MLLLFSLSSSAGCDNHLLRSPHTRTRLVLYPAGQISNSDSSSSSLEVLGTSSSFSSNTGGSIAQQLLSQLSKGPTGNMLLQHILPLTNYSSLSAVQLPLLL
jgi:hypothetical protein